MRAPDLLNNAAALMEERGRQYDKPEGERSMGRAVQAFNAITGQNLRESHGWLLLQLVKDVRDQQRAQPHQDSLEDCIAYAALKAEARMAEAHDVQAQDRRVSQRSDAPLRRGDDWPDLKTVDASCGGSK